MKTKAICGILMLALTTATIATAQAVDDQFPQDADTELVMEQCTICHGPAQIVRQPKDRSAKWWQDTLNDMVDTHGAELNEEQKTRIMGYLLRHYSNENTPVS